MSYRFDLNQSPRNNFSRIGQEQISKAHRALNKREEMHRSFLEARKSFKKLRAVIDLGDKNLPAKMLKTQKQKVKSLSQYFTYARDLQAMIEMLLKLEVALEGNLSSKTVRKIRRFLIEKRDTAHTKLSPKTLRKQQKLLEQQNARWRKVKPKSKKLLPILKAYSGTYQAGMKALNLALKTNKTKDLHDWRKHVIRHRRQSQLLSALAPTDLLARSDASRDVSKLLGAHQDLTILCDFVKSNKKTIGLKKKPLNRFLKQARKQRKIVETQALLRGKRLYALPVKAMLNRIIIYRDTLGALEPLPLIALNLDDGDERSSTKKHSTKRTHTSQSYSGTGASTTSSSSTTQTWLTYPYDSQMTKRYISRHRRIKRRPQPKKRLAANLG